nr:heme exporter protein CcmB [Acidobacteriota bacterium]
GLARQFGRRPVLRDVTFEASGGEVVALLGPNGSGKTTLLGVLSTLAEPSRGVVAYPGTEQLDTPRRHLGVLGHEPQLYGELSARENLEVFARLAGVTDVGAAVAASLHEARLVDRADDLVERFSRGMRQRLAFERVLLHAPRLLLLDEPFTGLDDDSAARLVTRLGTLRDAGVCILLATHDLVLVESLVDRALVVRDGRLASLAPVGSLADAYRASVATTGRGEQTAGQVPRLRPAVAARRPPAAAPRRPDPRLRDVLATAWLLFGKDLRVEWRTREGLLTTACFALSCVLVFAFGLVRNGTPMPDAGPAVLWITIALAGTLAMARSFERERASGTLTAVLASAAPRPAIYLGKWWALMALLFAVEAVLLPLVALFFQMPLGRRPLLVIALLVAGTAGYAAVGTLFAAMLARTRTRDVLLPLLLYPMSVPLIIGGVRGTAAALADPYVPGGVGLWLSLLICFDAVFVTLALWTFDLLMTEAAPRVAKEA